MEASGSSVSIYSGFTQNRCNGLLPSYPVVSYQAEARRAYVHQRTTTEQIVGGDQFDLGGILLSELTFDEEVCST